MTNEYMCMDDDDVKVAALYEAFECRLRSERGEGGREMERV